MNRHINSFQNMWHAIGKNWPFGQENQFFAKKTPQKGRGDSEEKLFGEAQSENMTQMHALWNFLGDLGTFWVT